MDVLVVGAGPTGLTLATQLAAYGVKPRLIDKSHDRVHESRALAIQPRTLEVLAGLGVTPALVERGNRAVRVHVHSRRREVVLPMFDLGLDDTAYPYLLFLAQAETERILGEHLARVGVAVERGVELVGLASDGDAVSVRLRGDDGQEVTASAQYVVGCDGAHSTVREAAGIGFEGGSYPQTFVLADAECDGIEPDAAHAFLSDRGLLFFFPLGAPASWRLLAMRPPHDRTPPGSPVLLDEVQAIADASTGGLVRLHDPVWMTNFRLHHRAAAHYRAGCVFLAGDAAHIHSPAGGQGMNTGIQDAVNLGWKLAQVLRGHADPAVLDTYEQERAPVGRTVLRFTDRAFTIATSTNPLVRFGRARLAPVLLPLVCRWKAGRAVAFRTVSELGIRYRDSALSLDGPAAPRRGPRAGDRLPDGSLVHDGRMTSLHTVVGEPGWHLLLCGPRDGWPTAAWMDEARPPVVALHRISATDAPNVLHDPGGKVLHRLGVGPGEAAHYLVRPDGHIGYRSSGTDLVGLDGYLRRWLPMRRR